MIFIIKSLNFSLHNRAENLMRNYNLYKHQRPLAYADGPGMRIHKKPLALINAAWYDRKNFPDARHAVPSPIVALRTPFISAWLRKNS